MSSWTLVLWQSGSNSDQCYFSVKAESDTVISFIDSTHELIQILLRVYVLNLKKVMLVILSDDGNTIMSVTDFLAKS